MPPVAVKGVSLESQQVLAEILGTLPGPPVKPTSRRRLRMRPSPPVCVPAPPVRTARQRQARCSCGTCERCLEDARWERIFNEKFADPSYYRRTAIRHNSALANL
jgi:hypothetical protein